MKPSIYNSAIEISDKHTLLFNALSGKFVIVKDEKVVLDEHSLTVAEESNRSLFRQLVDGGMAVEDSVDEVAALRKIIDETDNDNTGFTLHINPTLDCNFRCWYCYEKHLENSLMSGEVMSAVRKFIAQTIRDNDELKAFHIGFFGGEPLLGFDDVVKPLIEFTAAECERKEIRLSVNFTSNGALLTPEMTEFLCGYNSSFQITLDGYRDSHDKTRFFKGGIGSYDTIFSNVIGLAKKKIHVILRVNYTEKNVPGIGSLVDDLANVDDEAREYIRVDFQRVWQERNGQTDEAEAKVKEYRRRTRELGYVVLANYIPRNVTDSCYGDKKSHVLINYNGDAFGCTARDFVAENRVGVLDDSGKVEYDEKLMQLRASAKFGKKICQECRIAPLCGGGCRQRAMEAAASEECTMGYSEDDKDNIVLDLFDYSFCSKADKEKSEEQP